MKPVETQRVIWSPMSTSIILQSIFVQHWFQSPWLIIHYMPTHMDTFHAPLLAYDNSGSLLANVREIIAWTHKVSKSRPW